MTVESMTATVEVKEERKAPQGVIIPPPEIRGNIPSLLRSH